MSAENKEVVRRIFEDLFNRGDVRKADELVASDLVEHSSHPSGASGAGAISGERTLEEFYARLQPFAIPFMALFDRDQLPARSTLSRFLAALTEAPYVLPHSRLSFHAAQARDRPAACPGSDAGGTSRSSRFCLTPKRT